MNNEIITTTNDITKTEAKIVAQLNELASLLNVELNEIKDEYCLFQIKKLMSKVGKVILRYNFTDAEIISMLSNCNTVGISEVLFSPSYLPAVFRENTRSKINYNGINAIIDFPFGESLYKSKLLEIKSSIKLGVKCVTVMMPTIMLTHKNLGALKKQAKAVSKLKKVNSSLAFNGVDLTEDGIKTMFKVLSKTKLKSITITFNEESLDEIVKKIELINEHKGALHVRVLANVTEVEQMKELLCLGVEQILTPYAEEIAKRLLERFNITKLKLN